MARSDIDIDTTCRLGQLVGYALHSENSPVLLADDECSTQQRINFSTTKSLWVTDYDPAEPAYYRRLRRNSTPAPAGFPASTPTTPRWKDTDVVLSHTFGLTRFSRPEGLAGDPD